MATLTAVGPRLDLQGPPPVAPPHCLLKTPGVVVAEDSTGRWLNGVNVRPFPPDVPLLWDPCLAGTFRDKADADPIDNATFDAFVCYLPITCSSLGVYTLLQEQAEAVLEATYSFAVEEALAKGVSSSANPYLGDANLTILGGGTAKTPAIGLAYLEDAIAATGRMGMIHATPGVVARLQPIHLDPTNPFLTSNGTPVVSGDGYIDTDPVSGNTPGASEDWIFATGPVQVRIGPVVMTDVKESLDRAENILTFRAERYVLVEWDVELQAGVLVDWAS